MYRLIFVCTNMCIWKCKYSVIMYAYMEMSITKTNDYGYM